MLYYIRKSKEIHNILSINRLWRTRLYEIGIVIKDSCLYSGLTGLLSRSIKIIIDARFTGYEFYEILNYSIFYSSIGDCSDRYILRFNEMIECCRIIYSLFYILLHSSFFYYYNCFFISMELLIKEFLINRYWILIKFYLLVYFSFKGKIIRILLNYLLLDY